jgi:hypothetical protein
MSSKFTVYAADQSFFFCETEGRTRKAKAGRGLAMGSEKSLLP